MRNNILYHGRPYFTTLEMVVFSTLIRERSMRTMKGIMRSSEEEEREGKKLGIIGQEKRKKRNDNDNNK